ncbi:hypothetical protein [Cohnella sp. JJ-181]|uniref:hypothetical protein n=1 Tax=Cohnella rhizoplanae TaxID=2974897 RepID=UPI0022FF8C4E|nr:hypothetical protein [Cohnella sp. JJ-181]CAI6073599.1 hypothetical protein COHCIP112018_02392 [Cohnella sp. JJ-181]
MLDIYTYQDDLYPLVTKWFNDRLDKKRAIIKQVIGFESIDRIDLQEQGVGGYGLVPKYDGSTIPELNQKRGFKKVYTPEEYSAKASIQWKYAKVDMSGEAKKAGTRMADSLHMTQLRAFYNLFANGWNGSFVGADGQPLFSAAHPIANEVGAETFSNTGTDTFSIAAITKTQTAAQRFKTFDGLEFDCDFNIALVSPELEPKAKEYFGADAKLIPDSAENGANPVKDMNYIVIKGFSAKQWAVGDKDLMMEMMKMVEITAPTVIRNKPDNPLVTEFVGYMDFTMGWSDARQIFGHNPA